MNALRLWWNQYMSSEAMAVSLVLWLCSLVAVGLIVTPWFGSRVAGLVALGLLLTALLVCWGICIVHLVGKARKFQPLMSLAAMEPRSKHPSLM